VVVDLDGRIGLDYGVYGVPETFLIDRAGIIRYKKIGPLTQADVVEDILPLIEELNR
jgi:cytochrome c biogenesis protein CcmG/thiol:disulfide interchange protein DsbE